MAAFGAFLIALCVPMLVRQGRDYREGVTGFYVHKFFYMRRGLPIERAKEHRLYWGVFAFNAAVLTVMLSLGTLLLVRGMTGTL